MPDMYSSIHIHTLKLQDPFGLSRGTRRSVKNLFLAIGDGWGEGAPIYYQDQSVESMAQKASEWLATQPDFCQPIETIINDLQQRYPHETGLWQAIDLAWHDAWGKRQGKPLYALWNIPWRENRLSSFTIGMDDLDTVMRKVEKVKDNPILKVKVGGKDDLEMIQAIHLQTGAQIYVDANEGWSVEQTLNYLPSLKQAGVQLIEQPLPRENREGYRTLQERTNSTIPIILDESVQGPEDISSWADLADGINIKLAKCGGLFLARQMIASARKNDLLVMLGCMIESSLAVTAAAHLAPLVDFIDLDGAALISNDPFGGMRLKDGVLELPHRPGIGAVPHPAGVFSYDDSE